MKTRPITARTFTAVAVDICDAAGFLLNAAVPIRGDFQAQGALSRATGAGFTDRGAPPFVVLAVGACLVRAAMLRHGSGPGGRGDDPAVADALMAEASRSLVWGLAPDPIRVMLRTGVDEHGQRTTWLEELDEPFTPPPTLTPRVAHAAHQVLALADPRVPVDDVWNRAQAWCAARDYMLGLEAISAAAELLAWVAGLDDCPEMVLVRLAADMLTDGAEYCSHHPGDQS